MEYNLEYAADYYPYGRILREFNPKAEKYLSTHHERDTETGLDYRGARYYDSDVARFLSLDPKAAKYINLTPYNYVAGNPIVFVDPDGREIVVAGKIGFKLRTKFNIFVLRRFGPPEIRENVKRLQENTLDKVTISPTDGKVKTVAAGGDSFDSEISLNRKGSKDRSMSPKGEKSGTFVKNRALYTLANELSHAEDISEGGEPGIQANDMAPRVDEKTGKGKQEMISNDEVDSNKDENKVRKRFGAKSRKENSHYAHKSSSPRKARRFRKRQEKLLEN
jgi:RHS repeat-associated protein